MTAVQPNSFELPAGGPDAPPHAEDVPTVLGRYAVVQASGLSHEEAERRLQRFGPNLLATRKPLSLIAILLRQFASAVVLLLAAAMAIAVFLGHYDQAVAIAVVLIVNTLVGFATERRAVRSMEALRQMSRHATRVRRGGTTTSLPAQDLVPGDIVVLDAGDRIPADLRILSAANMAADEAALTGESMSVAKHSDSLPRDARLHEKTNQLFKGTALVRGSGEAVVVGTGLATELGRITRLVEDAEASRSPLEVRLERLAQNLVWLTLAIAAVIAGFGVATGRPFAEMAQTAIALAVAAIPEGLPVVATLALARGMMRMARRNAVIENLAAVETLGATTVIVTDKTGTLTENRMTIERIVLGADDFTLDYAGRRILQDGRALAPSAAEGQTEGQVSPLSLALTIGALCSNAEFDRTTGAGQGDPIEVSLLRAADLAGLDPAALRQQRPELAEVAFDSTTRMMATLHRDPQGYFSAVKGAPEAVLALATRCLDGGIEHALTPADRQAVLGKAELLAREGYRLLALAYGRGGDRLEHPYEDLVLVGLAAFRDPARSDVAEAIRDCRRAGIRVVMVTGDHPATAAAIAASVSLGAPGETACEGHDIAGIATAGQAALGRHSIFARVTPEEKLQLVTMFQAHGDVVAMTGDGVNDAPALKKADIGIAMGQRGTQVAREAADMILSDDAFATIVHAIREGRVIFGNIRTFCVYLLSCNLSEIIVIALAIVSGLPLPLLPLQILFLNLVTDTFPAFALGAGEGDGQALARPPRPPQEPIVGLRQWRLVVLQGFVLAAATLGAFVAARTLPGETEAAPTAAFLTLGLAQLLHVFNMRPVGSSWRSNAIVRNPYVWGSLGLCIVLLAAAYLVPPLARLLELQTLDATGWAIVAGFSVLPLLLGQAALALRSRLAAEEAPTIDASAA